jgi:hypothetical protein
MSTDHNRVSATAQVCACSAFFSDAWHRRRSGLIVWLAIFACFLFMTCRQEDSIWPEPKVVCKNLSGDPFMNFWVTEYYPSFTYPRFNPLDGDEFAYARYENADASLPIVTQREIRIHRLSTGEDRTIYRGPLWSDMDWGTNGWILLNRADNQVWKIKSDGDSLTQLTFSGINDGAKWNRDASRFVARHKGDASGDSYTGLYNAEGLLIQKLNFRYHYGAWGLGDDILVHHHDDQAPRSGIDRFDTTGHRVSAFIFKNEDEARMDIAYDPQDLDVVFCTTDEWRLLRIDLTNENIQTLYKGCDTDFFIHFSVSPDGEHILADRVQWAFSDTVTDDGELLKNKAATTYNTIWLMNRRGNQMRRVVLE